MVSPAHWSRFNVKQVFEELQPKRTYTSTFNNTSPVHDSRTRSCGWEWYEMSFFAHWTPPCATTTILCFNLPDIVRERLRKALYACADKIDYADPYSILVVLVHQVLHLYDDSVWSIRDHVCKWEAVSFGPLPGNPPPLLVVLCERLLTVSSRVFFRFLFFFLEPAQRTRLRRTPRSGETCRPR